MYFLHSSPFPQGTPDMVPPLTSHCEDLCDQPFCDSSPTLSESVLRIFSRRYPPEASTLHLENPQHLLSSCSFFFFGSYPSFPYIKKSRLSFTGILKTEFQTFLPPSSLTPPPSPPLTPSSKRICLTWDTHPFARLPSPPLLRKGP